MDFSGRPTPLPDRSRGSGARRAVRRRAITAFCAAALLLAVGCAAPVIKLGKPPPTERLSQLKVAVSTAADVRAALGEPQGKGAARLPQTGLQDLWLYEYDEVEGVTVRLRMLMVFVDRDSGRYGGHLWFSSGQLLGMLK
jgi:hypothetical protein